jgi:integrase
MALLVLLCAFKQHFCRIAVLLCFSLCLRIGEALHIRSNHITFAAVLSHFVLLLPTTKTGQHRHVVCQNPCVCQLVTAFIDKHQLSGEDRLCATTYSTFRTWFNRGVATLGGADFNFRSHSSRRGGATMLFMCNVSVENIAVFGRWA